MAQDQALADEAYCYLTTRGRVTGNPHTIEIWFALVGRTLYMLAGDGPRADWVRNLRRTPAVSVRVAGREFSGQARVVETASEEDALARRLLPEKYEAGYSGDLTSWRRTALAVAVDLE
jgi:deazaflavin-dependent oxidoreductase (nitroreductase family)